MLTLAAILWAMGVFIFLAALGAYYPDSPRGYLNDFMPLGYVAAVFWIAAAIALGLHFL